MNNKASLILATSWKPNRKAFFTALGVSDEGLGEQLFGPVYDLLFIGSVEVKDEFRRFYSIEYAHLAEYVEIRYGKVLSEDELEAEQVFIVTDYLPQIIDDSYEESKLNTVLECIEKLAEAQNEDQT